MSSSVQRFRMPERWRPSRVAAMALPRWCVSQSVTYTFFAIGLVSGFALKYAVRLATPFRHHRAAMKRRYVL
jgi:hypothetical protein